MNIVTLLSASIKKNEEKIALVSNGTAYTYATLSQKISNIRCSIKENTHESEKNIGLIDNDDIETYASILAIWFEGRAYVPLSLDSPEDRNMNIIDQTNVKTIIDSSEKESYPNFKTILSKHLDNQEIDIQANTFPTKNTAYILFTSGTTGVPKGVPISFDNLDAFCEAYYDMGIEVSENDRFLQMFELAFDVSVMCYLIPLLAGARFYTIPKDEIKYSYIYDLMIDEKLTNALMVPSIIQYLRPYFDEIDSPHLKYSIFCGEALPLDIVEEWSKCVQNAVLMNAYGPTEDTMLCTYYIIEPKSKTNKTQNGIVSIGKPMKNSEVIVIDENGQIAPTLAKGELCLAGPQLTSGYLNNPKKNKEVFFNLRHNDQDRLFYKTGDSCFIDSDGDIMFLGRIDFQAKVQGGYRVELSEVAFHIKKELNKINVVAVAYVNMVGNTEIGAVIESEAFDTADLMKKVKLRMPNYMLPSKVKFVEEFPLNANGKIDRNALTAMFT